VEKRNVGGIGGKDRGTGEDLGESYWFKRKKLKQKKKEEKLKKEEYEDIKRHRGPGEEEVLLVKPS